MQKRLTSASLLISSFFVIAAFTNDRHQLAWSLPASQNTPLIVDLPDYGILLQIFLAYSLLIITGILFFFISSYTGKSKAHRWEATIIILLIISAFYAISEYIKYIPVVLGFLFFFLVIIIPKARKQSFIPFTRKIATNSLSSPAITLDARLFLIDINEPAEKLIEQSKEDVLGINIQDIAVLASTKWGALLQNPNSQTQINLLVNSIIQSYRLRIITLENWLNHASGHVITFENVTKAETLSLALEEKSRELEHDHHLQNALVSAVTEIGYTTTLQNALHKMAGALRKLDLEFVFGILDNKQEKLLVEFISLDTKKAEKITGIPVVGYEFSTSIWPFTELFHDREIVFGDNTFDLVHQLLSQIPVTILKKAFSVAKVPIEKPVMYIPLFTGKKPIGAIAVWGSRLKNASKNILHLFANQIATTFENARRYEAEQRINKELTRSKAFTAALSTVSATVSQRHDAEHIIHVLGEELARLGLGNLIARLSTDEQSVYIEYISTPSHVQKAIWKISGVNLKNFVLPKKYWQKIAEDYFFQGKALFIEDPVEFTSMLIPNISKSRLKKALELSIGHSKDKAVYLPLKEGETVFGILGIWGTELRKEDTDALTIFANQIAHTLENTRLYTAEQQRSHDLALSLEEKSVLLKEIHHRVKNNLQIISSLLNLQTAKISDDEILAMFTESRDRVRSMALVHEKLYRSNDLAQINFGEYLRGLGSQLLKSYSSQSRSIQMEVDIENINLSIDQAVPCGLIINEIITNSIKHAFPKRQAGDITIKLLKERDRQVKLVIKDNGIGIPNAVTFENPSTLGMQIIKLLTEQLHGEIRILRKRGTGFEIIFQEKLSQ